MKEETTYCPLCGGHPMEFYEGEAPDSSLESWGEEIEELWKRYQEIKKRKGGI